MKLAVHWFSFWTNHKHKPDRWALWQGRGQSQGQEKPQFSSNSKLSWAGTPFSPPCSWPYAQLANNFTLNVCFTSPRSRDFLQLSTTLSNWTAANSNLLRPVRSHVYRSDGSATYRVSPTHDSLLSSGCALNGGVHVPQRNDSLSRSPPPLCSTNNNGNYERLLDDNYGALL